MNINIFWSCLTVIFISLSFVRVTECACAANYIDLDGDCYRFRDTYETGYDLAEAVCANEDAHLAYIPDCSKFQTIITYLRSASTPQGSGFWIGATDKYEEGVWVWGNGDPVRMGVPFWGTSGDNWDPEPNGNSSENCAQLSTSDQYYFHDEDCEEGLGSPLCQKDAVQETKIHSESLPELGRPKKKGYNAEDVSCPEDFVYIGESCYFFGNGMTKKNAHDAQGFCQSISASLPILTDCFEFQQLVEEIEANYTLGLDESYWIGASDVSTEDEWIWNDSSDLKLEKGPPFWGSTNGTPEPSGEENQNCGILYRNDRYYIHDGECNWGTRILCQTSPTVNAKKSGYP